MNPVSAVWKCIKRHKAFAMITLALIMAVSGGFVALKIILNGIGGSRSMDEDHDDHEYETLSSLKSVFFVDDAELSKSVEDYANDQGFLLYKRAYYNFLNAPKYRVLTTGTSITQAGNVAIFNEKKFDGTNFYMHIKSTSDRTDTIGKMANNEAVHKLYVTNDYKNNYACVFNYDDGSKDARSEATYVYYYGVLPYAACNFIIRPETIKTSEWGFDEASGLYKVTFSLDAVKATANLVKQMNMISGTIPTYANGLVTYSAYLDENFILRKTDIHEIYDVDAGITKSSGDSTTHDAFYYEGESGFIPLAEGEEYDLVNDLPKKKDSKEVEFSKELSKKAIERIKQKGVNADLNLSVDGTTVTGRLQVKFGEVVMIKLDAVYGDKNISLYLALDDEMSGTVIVEYGDFKAGLEFTRLGDTVSKLLPLFGMNENDFDMSILNFNDMVEAFSGIEGEKISDSETYLFETNLNKTKLKFLSVPLNFVIDGDGVIKSFGIDHKNVLDTEVYLSLTPSALQPDIVERHIDQSIINLSPIIDFFGNDTFIIPELGNIISNKAVTVTLNATVSEKPLSGTVAIDFNDTENIKASADINVDGTAISVYYGNGQIYVKTGDIAVYTDITALKNVISALNISLDTSFGDDILDTVKTVLGTLQYVSDSLTLSFNDLSLALCQDKISLVYGEKINVEITSITGNATITEPTEEYEDISSAINFIANNRFITSSINDIISSKTVALGIDATISGISLSGTVAIDFNDFNDVKASADIILDGLNISVYYGNGQVYVKTGDVALTTDIDTIKDYLSVFGISLDVSLGDNLKDTLFDIISGIRFANDTLSLSYKGLGVAVLANKISLTYEKISADIISIAGNAVVTQPTGQYVNLSGLKTLIEKIYAQFDNRYFTINGQVSLKGITVKLENVKINNRGDVHHPSQAFDDDMLDICGTLTINSTHKLYIQYSNSTLFVVYNDAMRVKLSRSSLDYIVDLIKNEYKTIIQRLNYSEILSSTDSLTKLKDYEFSIGSVGKLLKAITVENGTLGISIKADDFGMSDTVSLTAKILNGNLALDVVVGENSGMILLNNTKFADVADPTESFIDLSGITGLVEGLVNAIKKENETYYLSGSARLVIPIIIDIDVNISMNAAIRLVNDADGGKKIEAVAHISCMDSTADIALAHDYINCGDGTLIYKDGNFYISRINKRRKRNFLGIPTSTWQTYSTDYRSMSRDYFSDHLIDELCFFFGLTSQTVNMFSTSGNETKIENCLVSYSATESKHTFVLNGSELAGSSDINNITAKIGVDNHQLTTLSISVPINVMSMNLTVNLTHEIYKTDIDYSEIVNLNPSEYTYFG